MGDNDAKAPEKQILRTSRSQGSKDKSLSHSELSELLSEERSLSHNEFTELDWTPNYPVAPLDIERSTPERHQPQSVSQKPVFETLVPGLPPHVGAQDTEAQYELVESQSQHISKKRARPMSESLNNVMEMLKQVNGFIAAAIAHAESGMSLATFSVDSSFDVEMAAAANTEVVRAKHAAMNALQLEGAVIEDILITLNTQYHLIRPSDIDPLLFIYVAVDREKANLALTRYALTKAGAALNV